MTDWRDVPTLSRPKMVRLYGWRPNANEDSKWGGWVHDAEHTDADWIEILYDRLTKLGGGNGR